MSSDAMTDASVPVEERRLHEIAPGSIEPKTAHLILLGIHLNEHGAAAVEHGIAARRVGVGWDELRGMVHLMFLLHGQPGAQRAEEFLSALAEREREDRVAGAVAAYG